MNVILISEGDRLSFFKDKIRGEMTDLSIKKEDLNIRIKVQKRANCPSHIYSESCSSSLKESYSSRLRLE